MSLRAGGLVLALFVVVACGEGTPEDAGTTPDSGFRADAAADSGGFQDAGPTDAHDMGVILDSGPEDVADVGFEDTGDVGGPDDAGFEADASDAGFEADASDAGGPDDAGFETDAQPSDSGVIGGSAACLGLSEAQPIANLSLDAFGQPAEIPELFGPPSISGDGVTILYQTNGSQFLPFIADDSQTPLWRVLLEPSRRSYEPVTQLLIDPTGRYLANNTAVRDRQTSQDHQYCLADNEAVPNAPCQLGSVSDNGERVAFISTASNLVTPGTGVATVYVRDRVLGTTIRASAPISGAPNGPPDPPVISRNGNVVIFRSTASNLVAGDTNGVADLFAFDLTTSQLTRVNTSALGDEANARVEPRYLISADGTEVAFYSPATNLDPNDTDGRANVFVKNLVTGAVERLPAHAGTPGPGTASCPLGFSADGRYVAYLDTDQGGRTRVYDRQQQAEIAAFPVFTESVQNGQITDDGSALIQNVEQEVFAYLLPGALGAATIPCPPHVTSDPTDWQWKSGGNPPYYYDHYLGQVVQTGDQVLLLGGSLGSVDFLSYDLNTRQWSPWVVAGLGPTTLGTGTIFTWTGTELITFGGSHAPSTIDPVNLTVAPIGTTTLLNPSSFPRRVWSGTEILYYGGTDQNGNATVGAAYNPQLDTWRPLPTLNAPAPRSNPAVVWTGTQMLVYGGTGGSGSLIDGGLYDPSNDLWTPIGPGANFPAVSGVWTGTEFFAWNGVSGLRYNPTTNVWLPLASGGPQGLRRPPNTNSPFFQYVARGDRVLVFGDLEVYVYELTQNNWTALSYPRTYAIDDDHPLQVLDLGDDAFVFTAGVAGRLGPVQ